MSCNDGGCNYQDNYKWDNYKSNFKNIDGSEGVEKGSGSLSARKGNYRHTAGLLWFYQNYGCVDENPVWLNDRKEKEYLPMQLHTSYTDMHGKEIRKTFLIYLEYSFISNPFIEQPELALFKVVVLEAA